MELEDIEELMSWQEPDWLLQDAVSRDIEKEAFCDPWETWTSSGIGCLSPPSGILFPEDNRDDQCYLDVYTDAIETERVSGNSPVSLGCVNVETSEVRLGDGPPPLVDSSPDSSRDPNEGCKVVGNSDGGTRSSYSNNSGTGGHLELEQASWDSVLCADSYLESKSPSPESGCNSSDEQVNFDTASDPGNQSRDTTAVGKDAAVTMDEETKRRIRLMRNRESATQSRLRKKSYVKELEIKCRMLESHCSMLQHTVAFTSRENVMLRDELNKIKCSNMDRSKSGVVEPAALPSDSLPSESPRRLSASGPFRWAGWELLACLYHALLLALLETNVQNRTKEGSMERIPSFRARSCQVPWISVLFTTLASLGRLRLQMKSLGGRVLSRPSRVRRRDFLYIPDIFSLRVVHRHQLSSKGRKHLKNRGRPRRRFSVVHYQQLSRR